jgi:hypothetical protein
MPDWAVALAVICGAVLLVHISAQIDRLVRLMGEIRDRLPPRP